MEEKFTVKSTPAGKGESYTLPSFTQIIVVIGLFSVLMLTLFLPDKDYSFVSFLTYISGLPVINMSALISSTSSFFASFPSWLSWLATPLSTISSVLAFIIQGLSNICLVVFYVLRYFWVA